MTAVDPFVVMAKPVGPVCNLDCTYCYYLGKKSLFPPGERFKMRRDVLEAHVISVIAASPGPLVHFAWHGGEPTLAGLDFYRQVVHLQAIHLPTGWRCLNNLQTNGTLLDETWCEFLADNQFAVGISIDGPAHLHDACRIDRRGRGTHSRVLRGLHLLREVGIEPDVLCTLNARNVASPIEVYRFFLGEGVRWLQFLPVVERARDGGLSPASVGSEAMGEFLCEIFDEWIRYDIGRIGVQNFLESFLVVSGRPANLCVMAETCGRVLALEHDGSIYACDHFVDPAHRLGNVSTDRFEVLLGAPWQVSFGEAKRTGLPPCCEECPVGFLCHGGCPKDRFTVAPNGETGLNYLCEGYRRFYSHARPYLDRMARLARDARPPATIMAELEVSERDDRRRWHNASRNAPCPCGSGVKYKYCCLATRRR